MDDILVRVWEDLLTRTTGPMWFRLILQPLVAAFFGVRAALANARQRQGAPRHAIDDLAPGQAKFQQAAADVGKVFVVGLVLDAVFQFIALGTFYPGEAVLVALLLVAVPYQILRVVVPWFVRKH